MKLLSVFSNLPKSGMKTGLAVFSALAVIGGVSLMAPQSADAAIFGKAKVNQHQLHQKQRIHHGYKKGALNKRETHRLMAQQHRINRFEHRYRNDGRLSPAERARLGKMQFQANKNIYRQKHDGQHRR